MEPHLSNRTWIFQANPDKFDVDAYLSSGLTKITWPVKQFRKEITPGDFVFIWRASGKKKSPAGIIAATTVLSEPWKGIDHPEAEAFWNESYEQKTGVHVWLSLEKHANSKEVLKRDWLKDDPICHDLAIFKQTRATNFKVTPEQEARLKKMWQRTGVSWDRSDLVAGLWAYYKTYGKPISKKAESPVSDVAIKIGRAVGGVYSKLMNLRYIDPRHEHGGLSSVGKLDGEVWSEFFNKQNNEIDHKVLEDEFNRLWSSFWSPGDLESYKENLDDQTLALQKLSQNELLNRIHDLPDGRGGGLQGYLRGNPGKDQPIAMLYSVISNGILKSRGIGPSKCWF